MASLRQQQINAVKQMLNLNKAQTKANLSEPVWKVLVYDRAGQDIISPLISVRELRELGVTLFVQLHSDRDPIPEVPAVYFCIPTEENLGRICQDFQKGTYDIYHLNFISPISRQKLEDLASAAILSNAVANIHKVYDQYTNFISLEEDMFVLKHQKSDDISYYAINKGDTKDTEMNAVVESIVDSLFSVFVTFGNAPIIRSPKGNAAEMIAKKLDKKLRENIFDSRNNLFSTEAQSGNFNFQRPLLIILDRNVDMATPLHHTWTYQALTHDILDLTLNRVAIEEHSAKAKTKFYELDSKDKFWVNHKGSPFPMVAESIQEELEQYRSSEEEVKRLKSSMGLDGEGAEMEMSLVSNNTAKITNAVNSLPQLLEKKRLIDMHTSVATAILDSIKQRRLDTYFELEEKIMSKTQGVEKSVMELINDPESGLPNDKLRLFVIFYICTPSLPDSELRRYEDALMNAGCDMSVMSYIKRWKGYVKIASGPNQYEGAGTKTVNMFSKLVSQSSNFVMEGVKNLVVKRHNLPVTRIVDHLMEFKNDPELEDYHYLDPKQLKLTEIPRNKSPFQDAFVFIVGGGNYIEYQNLMDYAKQKNSSGVVKRITYGASTLNNANQFLKQLALLGQEI